MKKCFKCKQEKSLTEFYIHNGMSDGRLGKCKDCTRKDTTNNLIKNKEYYRHYDKQRNRHNFNRIFSHKYSMMKQRVLGTSGSFRSSLGKELCTKEEFMEWCRGDAYKKFECLHKKWAGNGFKRRFAPSIDRINNEYGYSVDNLQWLTQCENSKKH